ncbi:hypothetical protein Pint_08066 [Pistacia integerrima]|uniref:Uncharacterized protein n=1 Tax=Pistacia integerrima TaxID=434235 RepID=A0ACC0XVX0_9ROSI|nr:hypothetical protein Pint_08066 [Pistacia integerrima]
MVLRQPASVIPAKRKTVLRMTFELILISLRRAFKHCKNVSSSKKKAKTPKANEGKKNGEVVPVHVLIVILMIMFVDYVLLSSSVVATAAEVVVEATAVMAPTVSRWCWRL